MFRRYTLIGSSKTSMVFYDKKLKRAVTFNQIDINKVSKKWSFKWFIYWVKIKRNAVNKLLIKSGFVVIPLLLLIGLTFFRETYTTFHLYLFLTTFVLLGVIVPIVVYKAFYWGVKYLVPSTASLNDLNEAFIDCGICNSNVYEKITFKIWVRKIIGPMCYTWFTCLLVVSDFWDKIINNQIVNAPINRISLICNFAPGMLFGISILITIFTNMFGKVILLKKHQRGEIETLPDVEVETIVNKDDSLVEKEVRGEEYGK